MHKTDNDTLSRADSIGANFGVSTQNNLDSIMRSLLDTKLAHRASMKDTQGDMVTQEMIDEDLDARRTSLKQVRMQM